MASRQTLKYKLIRKLAKIVIRAIFLSCHFSIEGHQHAVELRQKQTPFFFIIWHRHIFCALYHFRNSSLRPLVSLSKDGELITQIALEFGIHPIRGSSSKGGAMAFLKLTRTIKKNEGDILITADGPKGPCRQIKDGTVLLAHKTQAHVIPISWYGNKVKIFTKTWDQFIIPLPFSRIIFKYGAPILLTPTGDTQGINTQKNNLKQQLDSLETEIKQRFSGLKIPKN